MANNRATSLRKTYSQLMVSTLEIARRVGDLVKIPSVNPLQAGPIGGSDGETALAHYLANWAEELGGEVVLDDVLPGRPNLYARFAGEPTGDTEHVVVIDAHLDTVSVEHMTQDPFDGRIEDERVYGRGSVDTKATFAIVLCLLEELFAEGKRPASTIYLVGTVSEETGGLIGARGFASWVRQRNLGIDQLIVAEPTICAPVYGHKGVLGLNITLHGHAAHSSKPHLGQNAVSAAARVVMALEIEAQRLAAQTAPTDVGNGTISTTMIKAGLGPNIIPDCCTMYADRRVAPGEEPASVFSDLSKLVQEAASPLQSEVEMASGIAFGAFYQDPNSELVQRLAALADTAAESATYGSNACSYQDLAKEIVLFGPGSIDQAHQAIEWVDLVEIDRAAAVYRTLLRGGGKT